VKPKVFVTRTIPDSGIKLLQPHCQVKVYSPDMAIPRKELLSGVKWCDALLCLLTDTIDIEVIDANPKLKIIANYAVGYDNIDVLYATKKRIPVTNTPGALEHAVAEHTFALLMAVTRRIVEADTFMRQGKYKRWEPNLLIGMELQGKTIGIVGLGRIGSGVAQRAVAMQMKVLYSDVKRNEEFERIYSAKFVPLPALLKTSDVVSLHVPLLLATRHLIGKKELALMKKTAYLINTSRGAVIDEKALVFALQQKQIAGAGMDVYEFEPVLTKGLTALSNVVLTPHIASATTEARSAMSVVAAKNILAVLEGKQAPNAVNKGVYGEG